MKNRIEAEMDENRRIRGVRGTKALGVLGVPPQVLDALPTVFLTGKSSVEVEHHCGVLKIGESCIRLYSPIGIIRIVGRELVVSSMDNERICIGGCVKSVCYE